MNFEHTEDRRMLADSLNRFIAEQYAFETRDRIAKSAAGLQHRDLAAVRRAGRDRRAVPRRRRRLRRRRLRHRRGLRGAGPRPGGRAVARRACWPASAIAAAGSEAQKEAAGRDHRRQHRSRRSRTTSPARTTSWRTCRPAPSAAATAGCSNGAKAVVQHGEQADLFVVSARTARRGRRRSRHLAVPRARRTTRAVAARLPDHRRRPRGRSSRSTA